MIHMIRKFAYYWLPPLVLMGAIFLLSSRESISVSKEFIHNFLLFKSLHIAEYALLMLLLFRAIYKTIRIRVSDIILVASLLAVLYGLSDEIHQTFVPTRNGSLLDIFIDSIGITGMGLFIKTHFSLIKKYMY